MIRLISFLFLAQFGLIKSQAYAQVDTISLKLMSYNIRHGEGMDGVLDLSRAAQIIKAQALDLCGLQEVDEYCLRTDSVSQTEFLAHQTGMIGTFGKFMDYQKGAYGMATLSAKTIASTKVLKLPDAKYEPRSAIVHEIQLKDGYSMVFANVHFDWTNEPEGETNQLQQAKALIKYIDQLAKATIIVGDFNCTPYSPTMQYFKEIGFVFVDKGKDNLSFQGESKVEIDHVIYRNSEMLSFKEKEVQLLDAPMASDHRPLVVEFTVSIQ